jgi:hypothetical protein
MKKARLLLILFLCILYLVNKVRGYRVKQLPPLDADIVIAPGGYRGVYTIGICHYLKNHFMMKDKTFLGFSSGSFNSVFMTLDKEQDNLFLQKLFTLNKRKNLSYFVKDIIEEVQRFDEHLFDIKRIHIGVSTPNGLECFKDFLTLKDALYCCQCSSFVPFVTYKDIFLVYKNRLTFDGGLFYRRVKKQHQKQTLFIDSTMFGRYKPHMFAGLKQPKKTLYQLYIDGYHDAQQNHAYFEQYLTPIKPNPPPTHSGS